MRQSTVVKYHKLLQDIVPIYPSTLPERMRRAFSPLKDAKKPQRLYALLTYLPLRSYGRESNLHKVVDVKLVEMQQEVPFARAIKAESVIIIS
jgi:hypothetical protein